MTEDLIGLVKQKMGGELRVEDLAVASRLLRADRGTNVSQVQIDLRTRIDSELADMLNA